VRPHRRIGPHGMTEGGRAGRTYASRPLPRIVSVCGMSFQLQAGKGRGWRHADLPSAPHFDASAASRAVIGRAGGRAGWLPRPVRSAVIAWPFFVRPRGRFRSTCTSAKRPAVAAERSTVSNAPQRSPCGFLNRRGAHLNSSVFADTGRGRVRHCAPPPTSSAFASCGHSVA
jgi:hypothetical protein